MLNRNGNVIVDTALYGPVSLYQDVEHNETMGYDKYAFEAQIGGIDGTYISFSTLEEAVTRLTMGDITIGEWLSEKLSLGGGLADFCDLDLSYMDNIPKTKEPYSPVGTDPYVWIVDDEAKFGGRWSRPARQPLRRNEWDEEYFGGCE